VAGTKTDPLSGKPPQGVPGEQWLLKPELEFMSQDSKKVDGALNM